MITVKPEVFLVGRTGVDETELSEYLEAIGASNWETDAEEDGEKLIEIEGRLCYKAFGAGLNPNVTRIREGNKEYLQNIVKQAHGSVAEHVMVNFIFHNVSRVFTHELVRHRVGTAISQESMRYVRVGEMPMMIPSCFEKDEWATKQIKEIVEFLGEKSALFAHHFALDEPATPFAKKKEITSAMRRFTATEGVATSIGWSANLRTIKNILPLRTHPSAEEEIRLVFDEVGRIAKETYSNLYDDMEREVINGIGYWHSINGKF